MREDDTAKVARLKPTGQPAPAGAPGRDRSEPEALGDGRGQVIQVATRCVTLDEFVEKFAAFAWEGSLVLPAAAALPVGTQGRFVILLRDHSVAMRGRCRVTEAKPTPVSPRNPAVKRVMMRVALLEMDDASRAVHKRLIALRSAPVPLPIPTEPSETTQIEPARHGSAPVVAPPAVAAPAPPVAAAPVAVTPAAAPPAPASPVAAAPAPPAAVVAPPVKAAPAPPPVSINKTMIGVGIGPDGKAFLSQPASTAPRFPTPPKVETRAPGAPDTLPANPLSELDANDVNSFIECTLLEADEAMAAGIADAPREQSLASGGDAPATARRGTVQDRFSALVAKLPPALRGKALRYAPYVGIAVISIVVGYSMRGSKPAPAPAAATAPRAAPAPVAPSPPTRAAPEAQPEIEPAEAQAEAPTPKAASAPKPAAPAAKAAPQKVALAEKPAPASRDCTARVVTEPKDAQVTWGDTVIGRSPIDAARVPCGPAKVTIERERWQVVTVDVDAQPGSAATVHERLRRPRATLAVTSTPAGAQISINHVGAGAAPKQIDVQRYEQLQIKATLKGYQPWTKRVYLKDSESTLDVQLKPRK
jgi:hypothetical protein